MAASDGGTGADELAEAGRETSAGTGRPGPDDAVGGEMDGAGTPVAGNTGPASRRAASTPVSDEQPTDRRREDGSRNGADVLPDRTEDGQRDRGAGGPRDHAADLLPNRGTGAMRDHPADGTDDRGDLGDEGGQPAAGTERTAGSHRAQISEPLVPPGEPGTGPAIRSRHGRHGQPDDDDDLSPWPEQSPAAAAGESAGSGRRARPVLPPVSTTVRRAERRAPRPPADLPAESDQPAVPGPLTLAASTARMEAEARIRAALWRSRGAGRAGASYQAASGGAARVVGQARAAGQAYTVGNTAVAGNAAVAGETAVVSHPVPGRAGSARPEVASGARIWSAAQSSWPGQQDPEPRGAGPAGDVPDESGIASAWGGPEFAVEHGESARDVVPLRPRQDTATYLDQDADAGEFFDEPRDGTPGLPRRSRVNRGYPIPRLPRTRRSGAIPGA